MIRDKNGKSPWVKARKKPGRKSQTSKYFDDEWRMEKKISPKRTRADGLCNLRCSPSRNHRQVPPPRVKYKLNLTAPPKLSFVLNFFVLPAFPVERSSVSNKDSFKRRQMLEKLWEQKILRLYESVASLDELIRYETFKDGLEIWFEGSQDTNLKNRVGLLRFSKLFYRNGLPRNAYR